MLRRVLPAMTLAALLLLLSTPVHAAQEGVVGDWEGLIAGQLRLIFHISEQDGELMATLDVPQQGGAGMAMNSATFVDGVLRMTLDSIGGVYEGTMQEDGSIAGVWTQSAAPQPQELNLTRQSSDR